MDWPSKEAINSLDKWQAWKLHNELFDEASLLTDLAFYAYARFRKLKQEEEIKEAGEFIVLPKQEYKKPRKERSLQELISSGAINKQDLKNLINEIKSSK